MTDAEMRGQDMQDAPERIWATSADYWMQDKHHRVGNPVSYTRTDLCVTEAECQRRIDAAVQAEREECAAVADFEADDLDADAKRFRSGSDPHYWRKNLAETHRLISAAIRARGQK